MKQRLRVAERSSWLAHNPDALDYEALEAKTRASEGKWTRLLNELAEWAGVHAGELAWFVGEVLDRQEAARDA